MFDGHDGILASHFAAQRLPAELLLGQLIDKRNDNEIKQVLHQALEAVERGFFDSIDDKLAEIANLKFELPDVSINLIFIIPYNSLYMYHIFRWIRAYDETHFQP